MNDSRKTKAQLIYELQTQRDRVSELESALFGGSGVQSTARGSQGLADVILNYLSEYILFLDPDMQIQWANQKAVNSAGMSLENLAGRYCFEVWHHREVPCRDCPMVKAFQTALPQEGVITSPENRQWLIRGYPVHGIDGNVAGVAEIAIDITRYKKVEDELRESEERYRRLVETSPDGITLTNLEGCLVMANEQGARLYGCESVDELLSSGKSAFDFIAPEDRVRAMANAQKTLEQGAVKNIEYNLLRTDGSSYPAEISASVIEDADGNPTGFIGIVRDITERMKAEEEHRKLQEKILQAQKLESLGVLAGGIAHDFNNLLMGVLGNASLALLEIPEGSPARSHVEKIEKSGRLAAEFTSQLFTYAGKGRFVVEPVNLSEVMEDMTHLLKVSISKNVSLKYDLEADLPPIQADYTQIRQVVMNLITNASEAIGEEAGVVSLRTGVMHANREYFMKTYLKEGLPGGTYVYMEISDTGCGMDEETISRIFDPFFSTKFTGRGLGLAAVLGIVRGHHGAINVSSEQGSGTTFTVLFPQRESSEPHFEKVISKASAQQSSMKILVIDDKDTVRDVAANMLRASGYEVLTAVDGREGVEVFRLHADDISAVLLDYAMPTMNGAEALREIRNIRSDIPIILSSGFTKQEASDQFAGRGQVVFLQKPYRVKQLSDSLRKLLGEERNTK